MSEFKMVDNSNNWASTGLKIDALDKVDIGPENEVEEGNITILKDKHKVRQIKNSKSFLIIRSVNFSERSNPEKFVTANS